MWEEFAVNSYWSTNAKISVRGSFVEDFLKDLQETIRSSEHFCLVNEGRATILKIGFIRRAESWTSTVEYEIKTRPERAIRMEGLCDFWGWKRSKLFRLSVRFYEEICKGTWYQSLATLILKLRCFSFVRYFHETELPQPFFTTT